jgi:hypothetical protein
MNSSTSSSIQNKRKTPVELKVKRKTTRRKIKCEHEGKDYYTGPDHLYFDSSDEESRLDLQKFIESTKIENINNNIIKDNNETLSYNNNNNNNNNNKNNNKKNKNIETISNKQIVKKTMTNSNSTKNKKNEDEIKINKIITNKYEIEAIERNKNNLSNNYLRNKRIDTDIDDNLNKPKEIKKKKILNTKKKGKKKNINKDNNNNDDDDDANDDLFEVYGIKINYEEIEKQQKIEKEIEKQNIMRRNFAILEEKQNQLTLFDNSQSSSQSSESSSINTVCINNYGNNIIINGSSSSSSSGDNDTILDLNSIPINDDSEEEEFADDDVKYDDKYDNKYDDKYDIKYDNKYDYTYDNKYDNINIPNISYKDNDKKIIFELENDNKNKEKKLISQMQEIEQLKANLLYLSNNKNNNEIKCTKEIINNSNNNNNNINYNNVDLRIGNNISENKFMKILIESESKCSICTVNSCTYVCPKGCRIYCRTCMFYSIIIIIIICIIIIIIILFNFYVYLYNYIEGVEGIDNNNLKSRPQRLSAWKGKNRSDR